MFHIFHRTSKSACPHSKEKTAFTAVFFVLLARGHTAQVQEQTVQVQEQTAQVHGQTVQVQEQAAQVQERAVQVQEQAVQFHGQAAQVPKQGRNLCRESAFYVALVVQVPALKWNLHHL
ncbi:MAG: hypothetical protein II841_07180, partial [Bacteroidales bacterium]|nr:hypothetical protein [Bacteroidales bacterium]